MSVLPFVDDLFSEFCGTLSGSLRDEAHRLAWTLGLAPEPKIPWSRVFSHEVTLGAPALFAEGMSRVPKDAVHSALAAHAFGVIEAMGVDRIADGQARSTQALGSVLSALRSARDEHLVRCAGRADAVELAARAGAELGRALAAERQWLARPEGADFVSYARISEQKQAPGLVATVVLAERAGWDPFQIAMARRALLDIALALQSYDDVVDWEEDAQSGRSWAVAISRNVRFLPAAEELGSPRASLHASGVLVRLLRWSRIRFRASARRAVVVGARRLAAWAEQRAMTLLPMAEREERCAGYLHRARALAPWAHAVLAQAP